MRVLCAIRAETAFVAASVMEIGISPDFVTRDVTLLVPAATSGARHRNHDAAPMVGWPANGISHSIVKMSMVRLLVSRVGCTKIVSERLNSFVMMCFCSWVNAADSSSGRKTTASGLPPYALRVKTSRVTKLS